MAVTFVSSTVGAIYADDLFNAHYVFIAVPLSVTFEEDGVFS